MLWTGIRTASGFGEVAESDDDEGGGFYERYLKSTQPVKTGKEYIHASRQQREEKSNKGFPQE